MHRALIATLALGLTAGLAGPALAAPPDEFTIEFTIDEVDPCSGEADEVSFTFDVQAMPTRKGVAMSIDAEIVTALGYQGRGHNTFVLNPNRATEVFTHVVRNDDTGDAYVVHGRFDESLRTGEIVETTTFDCLGR